MQMLTLCTAVTPQHHHIMPGWPRPVPTDTNDEVFNEDPSSRQEDKLPTGAQPRVGRLSLTRLRRLFCFRKGSELSIRC